MAHMISNVNGQDSFAYVGDPGWHGLGQPIDPATMTREQVLKLAGLDYTIEARPLYYRPTADRVDGQVKAARIVADKVIQTRSDTGGDLGIVSPTFQTVQPHEAYDIFQVWCREGGATVETLGALHRGRVYFGLARIGNAVLIDQATDAIAPYLYWSTACDGSRKTKIKNTAIRVVCANTDAMTRDDSTQFVMSHRSVYDPSKAREHVESALDAFNAYCGMARSLARVRIDSVKATELTTELVGPAKTPKGRDSAQFAQIMALFQGGKGSDLATASGTAWGWLNAVTDYADHFARATSDDNRLDSAQDGVGDALKSDARDLVVALV